MKTKKNVTYYLVGGVTLLAVVFGSQKFTKKGENSAVSMITKPPPALSQVKREKISIAGNQYLLIEVLRDDLAHFEMSTIDSHATTANPIITTPMVYKTDYAGPTTYSRNGNKIDTRDMQIIVDTTTLNVTVYDKTKSPALKLGTYSYLSQNQENQRGIQISKENFTNVYGLGQKFFPPGGMDGDLAGKNRMAGRPHGAPFGNVMEGFDGGMAGNTQFPIAYIVGSGKNNYAFFCDNQYGQDWSLSGTAWSVRAWGDWMRFYIITGPDLKDLRSDYMELTGNPPVPPKKAFGLWVSKYGYKSWSEIDGVLGTLKTNNFPIDGFILDLFWFTSRYNLGKLDFDAANFPNPAAKISSYKNNDGIGLVCIEESYINTDTQPTVWNSMKTQGFVVKDSKDIPLVINDGYWGKIGMIDWTNSAASQYWHTLKRKPNIVDRGVIGHWTDLGEPEMFDGTGKYFGLTYDYKPLTNHGDVHNLYCFLWNKSMWDGYYPATGAKETQRLWILARSGTSGSQRFGVGMWSGDVASKLNVLKTQMNAQMNIAMSGIDYFSSDIGGFKRDQNDGGDLEHLNKRFTQWFANGCMFDVPVRPHVDDKDPHYKTSPAEIGDIQANKENLRLRYELVPYYYSLAYKAHLYGEPVIPPLVYYYQEDGNIRQNANEKMIGPNLLVAVEADYDLTTKNVYLPAGNWYNYRTNAYYAGTIGRTIGSINLYDNGKFKLPLFAKAGAIIPLMYVDDQTANALGKRRDNTNHNELIAKVFADPLQTSFTLYEDEGTTTEYYEGVFQKTNISQVQSGNNVTITIDPSNGTYSNAPSSRNNVIQLVTNEVGKPTSVTLNGTALAEQGSQQLLDNAQSGWCYVADNYVKAKSGVLPVNTAKTFVFAGQPKPPRPPIIKATPENTQVEISWNAVSSAISYTLYYTTGSALPTKASNKIPGISGQNYTHTGLVNGTKYNYALTATNANGESDLSNFVSTKPNKYKSHYGNNPVLRLTGLDFANWDPANSQYVLSPADDYVWELSVLLPSAKTAMPYKITLNGTWDVNWGGGASGADAYLARTGDNALVSLAAAPCTLRVTEGATINDRIHVQWIGSTSNNLIVHFQEWQSAATYSLHCWDGLVGDYIMNYEGQYNGNHWWKVSLANAADQFKFCFVNSNNNWDGGNRIFINQAKEIYVKAGDNTIYTARP